MSIFFPKTFCKRLFAPHFVAMTSIRPVDLSELDFLLAFAERTFRTAFEADNHPQEFQAYCETVFTRDNFAAQLAHPHSEFWFACEADRPVAYLKLNFDKNPPEMPGERTVQVERLYVDADFQGRRIGEQLLDHAHRRAREAGAAWLWLSVWKRNPPAVRFYERNGYEIFGTEVFWVGNDPQLDWLVRRKV